MVTKSNKSASTKPQKLAASQVSGAVQRIDFQAAEVVGGFVGGTFFLTVSGEKPYINMEVRLTPLIYARQPEYWGIEVVGILPGIGHSTTAPYHVSIPLNGIIGTKGIEVIGATKSEKITVP